MGIGALGTVAAARPANLTVVVLDNGHFGETGMRPGHTGLGTDPVAVARGSGSPMSSRPVRSPRSPRACCRPVTVSPARTRSAPRWARLPSDALRRDRQGVDGGGRCRCRSSRRSSNHSPRNRGSRDRKHGYEHRGIGRSGRVRKPSTQSRSAITPAPSSSPIGRFILWTRRSIRREFDDQAAGILRSI
nr:hypothetical protein [Lentzea albida]